MLFGFICCAFRCQRQPIYLLCRLRSQCGPRSVRGNTNKCGLFGGTLCLFEHVEPVGATSDTIGSDLAIYRISRGWCGLFHQTRTQIRQSISRLAGQANGAPLYVVAVGTLAADDRVAIKVAEMVACGCGSGSGERGFVETLRRHFDQVARAKPPSSRRESSEFFLVAKGRKPGGGGL